MQVCPMCASQVRYCVSAVALCLAASLAQAESLTVCNQGSSRMAFAYWTEQGANPFSPECQLRRSGCVVRGRGWFSMDPGSCELVAVGDGWRAWFSVHQWAKSNGEWRLMPFRPGDLPSIEESGSTGISNTFLCGTLGAGFDRTFQGNVQEAIQEVCTSGLERVPVNMLAQTGRKTHFKVNLSN